MKALFSLATLDSINARNRTLGLIHVKHVFYHWAVQLTIIFIVFQNIGETMVQTEIQTLVYLSSSVILKFDMNVFPASLEVMCRINSECNPKLHSATCSHLWWNSFCLKDLIVHCTISLLIPTCEILLWRKKIFLSTIWKYTAMVPHSSVAVEALYNYLQRIFWNRLQNIDCFLKGVLSSFKMV